MAIGEVDSLELGMLGASLALTDVQEIAGATPALLKHTQ